MVSQQVRWSDALLAPTYFRTWRNKEIGNEGKLLCLLSQKIEEIWEEMTAVECLALCVTAWLHGLVLGWHYKYDFSFLKKWYVYIRLWKTKPAVSRLSISHHHGHSRHMIVRQTNMHPEPSTLSSHYDTHEVDHTHNILSNCSFHSTLHTLPHMGLINPKVVLYRLQIFILHCL